MKRLVAIINTQSSVCSSPLDGPDTDNFIVIITIHGTILIIGTIQMLSVHPSYRK